MIIDELLVALGYEFNDEELKQFNESVESVLDGLEDLAIAAGVVAAAFTGMAVSSGISTDELAKQARVIGIAVEELDAYNFAAEQAIGNSDGVADSLKQFSIRIGESARGTGSAIEAFGILGVSVTDVNGRVKDVNTLLLESSDALNRLEDNSQRLELADKLGLGSLDLLLREGSKGIRTLTDEAQRLGTVTAEDAKAAEEFNDQWNRVIRVFTNAVRLIATAVLPVFTELLEVFQAWFLLNQEIIQSGIIGFLEILVTVLNNLRLIIIAILSLKFVLWVTRLTIAIKALGAAALIANVKIFAIVAALAAVVFAIALVIEDFIVFQQGGDSAIGRLLERFPLLKSAIENIGEAVIWLRGLFTDLFLFIDKTATAISTAFDVATEAAQKFFDTIGLGVDVKGLAGSALDLLSNPAGFAINAALNAANGLVQPAAIGNTLANSNSNTNINRVEVNINGGNVDEVKKTVLEVFNGEIATASNNAQSPVRN